MGRIRPRRPPTNSHRICSQINLRLSSVSSPWPGTDGRESNPPQAVKDSCCRNFLFEYGNSDTEKSNYRSGDRCFSIRFCLFYGFFNSHRYPPRHLGTCARIYSQRCFCIGAFALLHYGSFLCWLFCRFVVRDPPALLADTAKDLNLAGSDPGDLHCACVALSQFPRRF